MISKKKREIETPRGQENMLYPFEDTQHFS